MISCNLCGKELGYLPFKCKYCGNYFCDQHRLPENHYCNYQRDIRDVIKEKKRERAEIVKDLEIGQDGMRSYKGTYILFLIIIVCSLLSYFFPQYLSITVDTFYGNPIPYLWTILTSMFVVSIMNIPDLIFFILLIIVSFQAVKKVEHRYGMKFLLLLYFSCAFITALLNLVVSMFFFFYFVMIMYYAIGLASGAFLGIVMFMILEKKNRRWYFFNRAVKGTVLLAIILIANIVLKIISTTLILLSEYGFFIPFMYSYSISWFIFDFWGLLAALIFYNAYFKKKYPISLDPRKLYD